MTEHTKGGGTTTVIWTGDAALDARLQTVADLFEHERTQDLEGWAVPWAENAIVDFPLDVIPNSRTVAGKESIVAWTGAKFVERLSTDIDVRLEAIAGAKRVIAYLSVRLHFENGLAIGGPLVMMYTFDDEGKVALMEEYVNDSTFPSNYKELAEPDEVFLHGADATAE